MDHVFKFRHCWQLNASQFCVLFGFGFSINGYTALSMMFWTIIMIANRNFTIVSPIVLAYYIDYLLSVIELCRLYCLNFPRHVVVRRRVKTVSPGPSIIAAGTRISVVVRKLSVEMIAKRQGTNTRHYAPDL